MKFSLIICTYQRPEAILKLLNSICRQHLYPNEIIIVDGSLDDETDIVLRENHCKLLKYFRVDEENRGLTRQRNFGLTKVQNAADVVCFLDDDTILDREYFHQLLGTYKKFPDAVGVGGYIINEVQWNQKKTDSTHSFDEFEYDGWKRKLGSRNALRKRMGLLSDQPPGIMPEFSNGLSIGFLPPSGKTYPVEFFMGGVSSFRKDIFSRNKFSEYFEGYGLYEDMDFCLRASRLGQLYVNTAAILYHYHEDGGRPNKYEYGKMVIRNGWYVWRVKYAKPSFKARLKWHATAWLLTIVRLGNVIATSQKKEALTEAVGRISGWLSLIFNKPRRI